MSIYERKGWYWGRKTIKGIEYRASLETRSKRDADAAYGRWLATLEQDVTPTKDTPFRVAVNNFTREHLPRLKKSSRIRYLQSLLLLSDHFENKNLTAISRADLAEFVSARRKTGVSDATILRDLACLSSVFTIAIDWELAETNPVAAFIRAQKRRKQLKEAETRTRHLDHAEELALLRYAVELAMAPSSIRKAEKWMMARALAVYIDTGMRAQELLSMRRSWVNLGRLEISIPGDEAKGDKPRTIPILPRTERILMRIPTNKHTDYVFWRCASGKPFSDLNHTMQRYAAKVGITDIHIHDLRRTCGCRLLQDRRMTMPEVSKWLGHASVVLTEKVYAFLKVENLHTAVGSLRAFENLRPALDAVLDGDLMQIEGKNSTRCGTFDIIDIETIDKKGHKLITHNP